jgi:hypothetical protein
MYSSSFHIGKKIDSSWKCGAVRLVSTIVEAIDQVSATGSAPVRKNPIFTRLLQTAGHELPVPRRHQTDHLVLASPRRRGD